mgnify:CR=1 FL=1
MDRMQPIGVLGGTGPEATLLLQRKLILAVPAHDDSDHIPGNNATFFQAMDQGKGDIGVHPDVWLPNQESFTKNTSTMPARLRSRPTLIRAIRAFTSPKISAPPTTSQILLIWAARMSPR